MGVLKKLTAVLHLDLSMFKRGVKEAKHELDGVGTQAKKTSDAGTSEFNRMALSVSAIGAAAAAAIIKLDRMGTAIAVAAANAARSQQNLSAELAGRLGGEDITRIARLYGQTEAQFGQRTAALAQQYDLTQAQVLAAMEPLGARLGERPELLEGAIAPTLMMGRARGVFGEQAGLIAPLLAEQFGAKTPEDISRGIAGIVSAAELSAIPAPAFGDILTMIAPTYQQAGVGLRGQVGLISGMAPFFPTRPREIGTQLMRLGELRLRKSPFLENVLQEQNIDPKTQNAEEILKGIIGYVKGGGDIQSLQTEGQVPFEVIRGIVGASTDAFAAAREVGLREFDVGYADPGREQNRLAAVQAGQASQIRRAGQAAELPGQEFGPPGGLVEAGDILTILQGRFASGISREERLQFETKVSKAQVGWIESDPAFTSEEALELQTLNAAYPGVRASLVRIRDASGPEYQTGTLKSTADFRIRDLDYRKQQANRAQFWTTQAEQVKAFRVSMTAALQFIRQAELGQPIEGPGLAGGGKVSLAPSVSERRAAGEAVVGGIDITEAAGGISAQQVIINQTGPESRTNNNSQKATTQPSNN